MLNKIINKLGNGSITYFIVFSLINFVLSYLYIYYITILFNERISIFLNSSSITDGFIFSIIYGILISLYLFIYIFIFIFFVNRTNIKNKTPFIIGNLNLYLLLYLFILSAYIYYGLSVSILGIYFLALPGISLILLLFDNDEVLNNSNNNLTNNSFSSQDELINNIMNDHSDTKNHNDNGLNIGNINKFDTNDNIENLNNANKSENKTLFGGLINGIKNLFKGKNKENKSDTNNAFINLDQDKNINDINIGNIFNEDSMIGLDDDNSSFGGNSSQGTGDIEKDLNLDGLLSTDIDNIEELIIDEDIEGEKENPFLLDTDDEDDGLYENLSVVEKKVGDNEGNGEQGNNEAQNISPASLYIKGFQINRVQDMEKIEDLMSKL